MKGKGIVGYQPERGAGGVFYVLSSLRRESLSPELRRITDYGSWITDFRNIPSMQGMRVTQIRCGEGRRRDGGTPWVPGEGVIGKWEVLTHKGGWSRDEGAGSRVVIQILCCVLC